MSKITRRETLAAGAGAVTAKDDDALLRDVGDWQEIQEKISASAVEREKRKKRLPERLRNSSIDPRGWQKYAEEWPQNVIARLREHEPHYVRAGMGEIEDKLNALWGDQDPITKRLLDARPVTLAGALSLASVWVAYLGSNSDSGDDWLVKVTNAAERSLADAARLAGTA